MMQQDWIESFEKKEIRGLSRLITASENEDADLIPHLGRWFEQTGKARTVGITGPPGAGKSTLIAHWVKLLRDKKKRVAVLAVDPVSPFTGGAVLGDRIRLQDHFNDPDVFIRSLSTRGKLGGLTSATRESLMLLDVFGFDYVLVETVGVGQSEVDIRNLVDATVLTLVPEWGDTVQALKAGILEIADLFLVHKADREGAERVEGEIRGMLEISNRADTPVLLTSDKKPDSIEVFHQTLDEWLSKHATLVKSRRDRQHGLIVYEMLQRLLEQDAEAWLAAQKSTGKNPYETVQQFRKQFPAGFLTKK
jgi:LAO/AO transport system kinase